MSARGTRASYAAELGKTAYGYSSTLVQASYRKQ